MWTEELWMLLHRTRESKTDEALWIPRLLLMLNTNCEWKIEFGSNSNPAQNSGAVDFQRIAGISFSSSCCVTRYVSYSSQLWLRFFFFFNSSELCYGIAESSLRWLRGEVVTREGSEVSFSEMNCEEWALIFEQNSVSCKLILYVNWFSINYFHQLK